MLLEKTWTSNIYSRHDEGTRDPDKGDKHGDVYTLEKGQEHIQFLKSRLTSVSSLCGIVHDFFAIMAISGDSELKALPATSEYTSFTLKPFSSNSF